MAAVARDDVLKLVEGIYRAATQPEQWGSVLGQTTQLFGGSGAVLEVIKLPPPGHALFHSHGVPVDQFDEYSAHIVPIAPRVHYIARQPAGRVLYDYQFITEQEMSRDESYEFFSRHEGRYFVCGVLQSDKQHFGVVTVLRSTKQGHADREQVELMELLLPHFRGALDLTMRWQDAGAHNRAIEEALNCLLDGVFLLRRDGSIAYANATAQEMARVCDGFSIRENAIQIDATASRSALQKGLDQLVRSTDGASFAAPPLDIPVPRASGQPPLVFTLKPTHLEETHPNAKDRPVAILFVHDPVRATRHDWRLIGEYFGLTAAELGLAESIHEGLSLPVYAKKHKLSMNTVYTHYRRLKDKLKCDGQIALIKRLTDLMPRIG